MHDTTTVHPAIADAAQRIVGLLERAEMALVAGEPDVVTKLGPQLIRTLKALVQVAPEHWGTPEQRRRELGMMSARIGALQLHLARTQATLARERGLLMPGGRPAPTYGPDGRVGFSAPVATETA